MILNNNGIKEKESWLSKGYELPLFDRDEMIQNTRNEPVWLHFGPGNIFHAYHAVIAQKALNDGNMKSGIVCGEFYNEKLAGVIKDVDGLCIHAEIKSDGKIEKRIVASVADTYFVNKDDGLEGLKEVFKKPSLQIVSFTVTEKGYAFKEDEEYNPDAYMARVTSCLFERYKSCATPIAMLSTDNCAHNGDRLKGTVKHYTELMKKAGLCDDDFVQYIDTKVSFPLSMIDKITPGPDKKIEDFLRADGIEGTLRFANAEETGYLVIEDKFPNGRPPLEKYGVIFADRETVDRVDRMKVGTCLNPLHTSLAVFGCLLGYTRIYEELKDEDLVKLIKGVGYIDGMPVVENPGVLDPKEFIDTCINVRFPNPYIPDMPQRIATDTSQKIPMRYGGTIKKYCDKYGNAKDLKYIPFVIAGWLRYLLAIDDEGNAFEPSSDPMLAEVQSYLKDVKVGDTITDEVIHPILEDTRIFVVSLYEAGIADKVLDYFNKLNKGPKAVRTELHNL